MKKTLIVGVAGNMAVPDAKRYKALVEKETGMKVVILVNVSSLAVVETEEES